jgi:hypothetical protein
MRTRACLLASALHKSKASGYFKYVYPLYSQRMLIAGLTHLAIYQVDIY